MSASIRSEGSWFRCPEGKPTTKSNSSLRYASDAFALRLDELDLA